jgi:dihydrofolate reductase
MGELVVGTFVTLDGVMQAPGGPDEDRDGGFVHGGWLVPHFDEEMGAAMDEQMGRAGALLLGRRTYEIFAAHWPRMPDDDPMAARLSALPKHVASRTLDRVDWRNSTLIEGEVEAAVGALKQRDGGGIHVTGSCDLIQTLIAADLVDEYRLWVFPVLLGTGKRLFGSGTAPAGLELTGSRSFATGATLQVYRRAGALEYGSFALDG